MMAAFDMEFPEDFLSELTGANVDDLCRDVLKEAAPILEQSMKKSLKSVIEHDGESDLVESIHTAEPKKAKNNAWIVNVGPKGYSDTKTYIAKNGKGRKTNRKYKVSNALKLIWKEYGIAGRQAPKPSIQNAVNDAQNQVMDSMQNMYNRRLEGSNGP